VLTAAAIKCLNGEFGASGFSTGQLGVDRESATADQVVERLKSMGISDPYKTYDTDDLARQEDYLCCTGVTDGTLMRGWRSLAQVSARIHW